MIRVTAANGGAVSANACVVRAASAVTLRTMKTRPTTAVRSTLVVAPAPLETPANTWHRPEPSKSQTCANDRGPKGTATRDEIRQEVSRKVPSRQSQRPQERRGQPRSHKAGHA